MAPVRASNRSRFKRRRSTVELFDGPGKYNSAGVGPIVKIHEKMTKEMYRDILSRNLLVIVHNHPLEDQNALFQQDNDPKHTAKIVKEWLARRNFGVLSWPSQSPDVNRTKPVEKLRSSISLAIGLTTPSKTAHSIFAEQNTFRTRATVLHKEIN